MSTDLNPEFDIAVVGMAGTFPGAPDIASFWNLLIEGKEGVTHFSKEELLKAGVPQAVLDNPDYIRSRGIIEDADKFDAHFFDISPTEAENMDPQHRLFLTTCWQALEDAGYDADKYEGLIGLFAGVSMNSYLFSLLSSQKNNLSSAEGYQLAIGNDKDFLTTRTSYKMNLRGPSLDLQTACSTSLVAIHTACQNLLNFSCDMAMAGGVSITIPQKQGYQYQDGMILSKDGHCRAFDAQATGTISGSGSGVVVLKRLEDALNEGDHIYAVVKGSAINNDGARRVGYTAPSVDGQADVISTAQAIANIEPHEVSYVEAHGTGTELGDPIEITALTNAFYSEQENRKQYCAIGSVKSNIGHLDAAAGVAGFIKAVLSLKHKQLPASLHFNLANPKIDFSATPFYVNNTLQEWKGNGPRVAGVSSFGIGGTNAHVVLMEMPVQEKEQNKQADIHFIPISAKSDAALEENSLQLAEFLHKNSSAMLNDVAYTAWMGRKHFNLRRFVVASSSQEMTDLLQKKDPSKLFEMRHAKVPSTPQIAFMFSGQGAQYVHMAAQTYKHETIFRQEVDQCAQLLQPHLGLDIKKIIFPVEADLEKINQTAYTQPALFIVCYALAKQWQAWGVEADTMLGHSIGEYVAATLAGVMTLNDALKIVAERGRLMQSLPSGSMLSIGLSAVETQPLLNDNISIAAINAAKSTVVSGNNEAIEGLKQQLSEQKIEFKQLHTSHAFHSAMMEPILNEFTDLLKTVPLNAPQKPYLSNYSGTWITDAEATDPAYYAQHLRGTVRFYENLTQLFENKEILLLEVGPGQTLSSLAGSHPQKGLNRTILNSLPHPKKAADERRTLYTALGKLWLNGAEVDYNNYFSKRPGNRLPLPTYAFDKTRYWYSKSNNVNPIVSPPSGKIKDTSQWLYTPVWQQRNNTKTFKQEKKRLVLTANDTLSQALNELCGQNTIWLNAGTTFKQEANNRFTINPSHKEDYKNLISALQANGSIIDEIVHLWNLSLSAQETFFSLTMLSSAIDEAGINSPIQLTVVTNSIEDITGTESLNSQNALVYGACRVLAQELKQFTCRTVDISDWEKQSPLYAHMILAEQSADKTDYAIAYRNSKRWVKNFEPIPNSTTNATLLKKNGTYLITGGLGRIGLVFAAFLAQNYKANLILVNRSTVPQETFWEKIIAEEKKDIEWWRVKQLAQIKKEAGALHIVAADAANKSAMAELFQSERVQPLNGIIHAAGTLGESMVGLIPQIEPQDLSTQMHSKVEATKVIAEMIKDRTLDFVLLQSSLSAILGGLGFASYSAGNHFLDAYSQQQNRLGNTRWITANWDGWRFELASNNTEDFSIYGPEGVEVLQRILSPIHLNHFVVSTGNLEQRITKWIVDNGDAHKEEEQVESARYDRPNLATAYVEAQSQVEKEICTTWQKLLGIKKIGIYDDFFDLGGNSLLGTQLIAQLRQQLKVELPIRVLFDDPTIAGVAKVVEKERSKAAPEQDLLADMLSQVENMDEEQVKNMLNKKD